MASAQSRASLGPLTRTRRAERKGRATWLGAATNRAPPYPPPPKMDQREAASTGAGEQGEGPKRCDSLSPAAEVSYCSETRDAIKNKGLAAEYLSKGDVDKALFHYKFAAHEAKVTATKKTVPEEAKKDCAAGGDRESRRYNAGPTALFHYRPFPRDEEILMCRTLVMACLNNVVHCYMLKGNYAKAITYATDALTFEPTCAKAYYRRGISFAMRGDTGRGIEDLKRALRLCPGDPAVAEKLSWAQARLEEEGAAKKAAYSKLFA